MWASKKEFEAFSSKYNLKLQTSELNIGANNGMYSSTFKIYWCDLNNCLHDLTTYGTLVTEHYWPFTNCHKVKLYNS
jgi:hypothetical protein